MFLRYISFDKLDKIFGLIYSRAPQSSWMMIMTVVFIYMLLVVVYANSPGLSGGHFDGTNLTLPYCLSR